MTEMSCLKKKNITHVRNSLIDCYSVPFNRINWKRIVVSIFKTKCNFKTKN